MLPDILLTQDRDGAQESRAALTVSVARRSFIQGQVGGALSTYQLTVA